jgi:undecaprenyl diphosphate synthase
MQSTLPLISPLHVAIIMDGNGRWARRRGWPRTAGHRAGVGTVRRIAKAAPGLGIATLTLFAFSADNWRRPQSEVATLMGLLTAFLRKETDALAEAGIRLCMIGRRDRLPARLVRAIDETEAATARADRLTIRIALDYSAREAIALAAAHWPAGCPASRELFDRLLSHATDGTGRAGPVDLLIRTGGEKRLSDFLLWECAYAELWFTDRMWPEFGADDLARAVGDFRGRERRFGGLSPALPATPRRP